MAVEARDCGAPVGSGSWFNLNPQGAYLPSAEDASKDSLVFRLVAESSPAGCNGSLEDIMIVHFIKGGGVSAGKDHEVRKDVFYCALTNSF